MIAIHFNRNSFASGWIAYCSQNDIPHRIVDCFDDNIIAQLKGCRALMWHYHHADLRDSILARQLLFSLAHMGMPVFPDFRTAWHFDDKLGQKYLFEALNLPSVRSYAFFNKDKAYEWASSAEYPKVFKLRRGAGSQTVELVKSQKHAKKLIAKSFSSGHSIYKPLRILLDRYRQFSRGQETVFGLLKGFARLFIWPEFFRYAPREMGYAYFQDFVPGNCSDIRVIVIGNKAFFIRRANRLGDFRASGGGLITNELDKQVICCVEEAFKINSKIKSQCIAFDFLINEKGMPVFVEISYGYDVKGYQGCKGYWDNEMNWYEGMPDFHGWMVEDLRRQCNVSCL